VSAALLAAAAKLRAASSNSGEGEGADQEEELLASVVSGALLPLATRRLAEGRLEARDAAAVAYAAALELSGRLRAVDATCWQRLLDDACAAVVFGSGERAAAAADGENGARSADALAQAAYSLGRARRAPPTVGWVRAWYERMASAAAVEAEEDDQRSRAPLPPLALANATWGLARAMAEKEEWDEVEDDRAAACSWAHLALKQAASAPLGRAGSPQELSNVLWGAGKLLMLMRGQRRGRRRSGGDGDSNSNPPLLVDPVVLSRLSEHAAHLVRYCTPRDLAALLHGLARLGWVGARRDDDDDDDNPHTTNNTNGRVLDAFLRASYGALPSMSSQALAQLLWALAQAGAAPSRAWQQRALAATAAALGTGVAADDDDAASSRSYDERVSPGDAVAMLTACARMKWPAPPPARWSARVEAALSALLLQRMGSGGGGGGGDGGKQQHQQQHSSSLTPYDVASAAWALARLQQLRERKAKGRALAGVLASEGADAIDGGGVGGVGTNPAAAAAIADPRLVEWLLVATRRALPRMRPREAAASAWALARLGARPGAAWMRALAGAVSGGGGGKKQQQQLTPRDGAALLWASSRCCWGGDDDEEEEEARGTLLSALWAATAPLLPRMAPAELRAAAAAAGAAGVAAAEARAEPRRLAGCAPPQEWSAVLAQALAAGAGGDGLLLLGTRRNRRVRSRREGGLGLEVVGAASSSSAAARQRALRGAHQAAAAAAACSGAGQASTSDELATAEAYGLACLEAGLGDDEDEEEGLMGWGQRRRRRPSPPESYSSR
jgi:hypothetical protein